MTTIVTRTGKGTSLSWVEADANFTNLNTYKLETTNNLSDLDSALLSRANLGIGNVDNTSDLNKPISTATQTALNLKADTTTVVTKDSIYVNVKDHGVVGDGSTDDTAAINAINITATATGKTLFFPAGTYIASNIPAISKMNWLGEGPINTILKLKNGTNADFITSSSNVIDDVSIAGIQFHGNSQNNTTGDTLILKGVRATLSNIIVSYSAGTAIITDWDNTEAERALSFLSAFDHVLIYKPQKHGWVHKGPSDCHFNNIEIVDAGLLTNNTYYGLYLVSSGGSFGSGRFTNVHNWNTSGATNVAITGVFVESNGNNFVNCHFEGSTLPLNITGVGNTFLSCSYYAPRGAYAVNIASTAVGTVLNGSLGISTFGTNYAGVFLAGSSCIVDVTNLGSGCINGVVDFSASTGKNSVRALGYQASGTFMLGTPHVSDDVLIQVSGISNALYKQDAEIPWTVYTPTVTSSVGALGSATGTGRYQKLGKTVHFRATATITTNGTGSGAINITLPFTAVATASCVGRENFAGKMLQGTIYGGTAVCTVFNYDNTYSAANNYVLLISGTYEVA